MPTPRRWNLEPGAATALTVFAKRKDATRYSLRTQDTRTTHNLDDLYRVILHARSVVLRERKKMQVDGNEFAFLALHGPTKP